MALRVIRLVNSLPRGVSADVLGKQLVRSATSVAANYYAACKGRSRADFLSNLGIVEEEPDETQLWIELIGDFQLVPQDRLKSLLKEVREITAIIAASRLTIKKSSKRWSLESQQSKIAN